MQRSRSIARFMSFEQGAEAIVVARNTATAMAVERLRRNLDIPIIGCMEPAIKPAAQLTRSARVAVLATGGTLADSDRYARLRSDHGRQIEVHECICHHWGSCRARRPRQSTVPRSGEPEPAPLHRIGVDTYVLGCTHYPFLCPRPAQWSVKTCSWSIQARQ